MTAKVLDVAEYILSRTGSMTAMKLQKMVYYSQAWHLVWEEKPLFSEPIQAWANGPVAPALYRLHRGQFLVDTGTFNGASSTLNGDERSTIDAVIEFYGCKTGVELSELTHAELPWLAARQSQGLSPGQRGDAVIEHASMAEYYESLVEPPDDCATCQ